MPNAVRNVARYATLAVLRRRHTNLRLTILYLCVGFYEVLCISTISTTNPSGPPGTVAAAARWLSGFGMLVLVLTLTVMVIRANADRRAEIMTLYRMGFPRYFLVAAPGLELGVISALASLMGAIGYISTAIMFDDNFDGRVAYFASVVAIILNLFISVLASGATLARMEMS